MLSVRNEMENVHVKETCEHRLLHEVFEEQADLNPAAPAVVSGAAQTSYAALDGHCYKLIEHIVMSDDADTPRLFHTYPPRSIPPLSLPGYAERTDCRRRR